MASPNATFTEMVTTTLRNHKRKLADNVTNHNALLRLMKERGNIKKEDGGYEIAVPLSYPENDTYQRYSGGDTLNIAQSDVLTAAKYDWKQAAVHVTATGRELRQNNGTEKLIDLVDARLEVAFATAANTMSVDIYSSGALTNQIGGLAHLITADGTGTVGGINAGTYTWWKNKFQEIAGGDVAQDGAETGTALTFANLKAAMRSLYTATTRHPDHVDLIVASNDMYSLYVNGLTDYQRYADAKMASLGFQAVQFDKASVIHDNNTNFGSTAEIMYFLNTKHLYMIVHKDADWDQDDEKAPINQDAVVIPIYWMGNMCCANRSLQGKLHDIAT